MTAVESADIYARVAEMDEEFLAEPQVDLPEGADLLDEVRATPTKYVVLSRVRRQRTPLSSGSRPPTDCQRLNTPLG